MKTIKDEDYSQLVLPIHGKDPDRFDPVATYEVLRRYPEFSEYAGSSVETSGLNRNKIIFYINYLYSVRSPLIKIYRDDLKTRKEEAAMLAGFGKRDMKKVEEFLFTLADEKILRMIMRFLIIQNNRLWTQICAYEQNFYETIFFIAAPLTDDKEKDKYMSQEKKGKIRATLNTLQEELDGLYDKFFAQADDVEEKFRKEEKFRSYYYSPETVAMRFQEVEGV